MRSSNGRSAKLCVKVLVAFMCSGIASHGLLLAMTRLRPTDYAVAGKHGWIPGHLFYITLPSIPSPQGRGRVRNVTYWSALPEISAEDSGVAIIPSIPFIPVRFVLSVLSKRSASKGVRQI